MLSADLPVRTQSVCALDAVAASAGRLQPNSKCAILLPTDRGFVLAAESGLRPTDRVWVRGISETSDLVDVSSFGGHSGTEVRLLLTQAAELVGALVLFDFSPAHASPQTISQLDEICTVATLVIEQKNLSDELSYRANHDPLTHLWNRSWMEEQISRALDDSAETGSLTGLIFMGVDGFRVFNELLGRQAANELLRLIAARLTDALEPGSSLARTGGDEFAILMPNLLSAGRVTAFARQLRAWLDKPFQVGNHELIVRASFGTATANPGECHSSDLQNRADQALWFAKRRARGRVSAFSPEMVNTPMERLALEQHLRFALQDRELQLHYQPQVRLLTGRLVGVEALLRWKHPSLGFISPVTFIPIAEEIGMIDEIGEWVISEAIRQLELWQGTGLSNIRMAVNVSPQQLAKADFAAMVATCMTRSRIKPRDLELEITETALMGNFQQGAQQLQQLRALGAQTALDDFGTGHSSLAYLQHLPIDRLKIDRMFVKDIVASDERPALLSSIIQMGLSLGCEVIAEGVETVEQALALSKMDCLDAQGFLFSKPLPPDDLFKWAAMRCEGCQ